MAFYGESWRITTANNIVGTAITTGGLDTIRYHFDGASDTVTAGESFMVGSEVDDPLELTGTDTAVVSWVVETGPGSSGSLSLSSGLDVDFTADDPGDATEALGTQSASGTQTLVWGPTSITVADLLGGSAQPVALIECTSGSVEVLQVKLRIWPPDGPGGAWVAGEPFDRSEASTQQWFGTYTEGTTASTTTRADAWDQTKAIIDNFDGKSGIEYAPTATFDLSGTLDVFFSPAGGIDPGIYGNGSANIALVSALISPATPNPSTDYGYDPAEVWREDGASIRAVGGGPIDATFVGWNDTATIVLTDAYVGVINLGAPPVLGPHANPSLRVGDFHYPSDFTEYASDVSLPDLGATSPDLALGVIAPLYYEGPPPEGVDTFSTSTAELGPLSFTSRVSGYEWFNPAGQAPRFYVKDLEGDWRPVGFGKPSTELAVFRVPTAVGRYRDLTTAEYATYGPDNRPAGGYPLKVKRLADDGSTWWDHVAWMVPE